MPLRPATSDLPTLSIGSIPALWVKIAAIGLPTGLALLLYWSSAAPGLTWSHYGADGGDLLAAAMVNGVAHPSGYPLYTLLLQGWLGLGKLLNPGLEIAYWGNRLSALCGAASVAFTVATVASLLRQNSWRWLWAMLAGLAWAITPLVWSQSLITEVYALHALLLAATGWALLSNRVSPVGIGILMGLGAAHHLTSILLWPAIFYWSLRSLPRHPWLGTVIRLAGVALVVALPFYARLVWLIASAPQPPPVAWGYPRTWEGLWWLVSGAAYRSYVFGMTPMEYAGRLAALARLIVEQFTPVGLALVIWGFALWDRQRPTLRNFALLWILPISLYAAGYNTVDSYVYLLPVAWMATLMLGEGLAGASSWLASRLKPATWIVATLAVTGIVVLVAWRMGELDLRNDSAARDFLAGAAATLEPSSLVISSADAPTFALWYGQWGSGTLPQAAPNLVLVNYALYQFDWYRQLVHDLYPEVPGMGTTIAALIAANRSLRPIYITEPLPEVPADSVTPQGSFWRVNAP